MRQRIPLFLALFGVLFFCRLLLNAAVPDAAVTPGVSGRHPATPPSASSARDTAALSARLPVDATPFAFSRPMAARRPGVTQPQPPLRDIPSSGNHDFSDFSRTRDRLARLESNLTDPLLPADGWMGAPHPASRIDPMWPVLPQNTHALLSSFRVPTGVDASARSAFSFPTTNDVMAPDISRSGIGIVGNGAAYPSPAPTHDSTFPPTPDDGSDYADRLARFDWNGWNAWHSTPGRPPVEWHFDCLAECSTEWVDASYRRSESHFVDGLSLRHRGNSVDRPIPEPGPAALAMIPPEASDEAVARGGNGTILPAPPEATTRLTALPETTLAPTAIATAETVDGPVAPVGSVTKTDTVGRYREAFATVTAYCPCQRCCGELARGITSIGKTAWSRGLAADPRCLSYGTRVYVPGYGVSAIDDTGGAMRQSWRRRGRMHIDVRMTYHWEARQWGRRFLVVRVYEPQDENGGGDSVE